ncbi:MAG TPA: DUF4193 family protein [Actinomycetota bacterium]|nr:DUF4193 family protein [Actinomycetota bacterium]
MEHEETLSQEEEEEETAAPEPAEASLDELLAKKGEDDTGPEEEPEDEPILATGPTDRVEPLAVKVVPQQPTEFVCKKCFLVKHRSQLADKKRMFCRDCA